MKTQRKKTLTGKVCKAWSSDPRSKEILPMPRISATARITFGLVGIITSLLLIAPLLGLFPDARNDIMRVRTQLEQPIRLRSNR